MVFSSCTSLVENLPTLGCLIKCINNGEQKWLWVDPLWCRLCIHVLYHIKMNNFVKVTFFESIIFKAKSKFESNVLKKHISSISIFFASFQSLILKSFPILKRYCAHLIKEKTIWKKMIVHFKGLSALNM